MAFHLLAEALLRIEHKLDIIIDRTFSLAPPHPQMQFSANACPVCKQTVQFQIDMEHQIAVRRCNCKTGLVPTTFKMTTQPPAPGVPNGHHPQHAPSDRVQGTEDVDRRKDR